MPTLIVLPLTPGSALASAPGDLLELLSPLPHPATTSPSTTVNTVSPAVIPLVELSPRNVPPCDVAMRHPPRSPPVTRLLCRDAIYV